MKISKTNSLDCESGIDNYEDNEENIQLDIEATIPVVEKKRTTKKVKISEVEMTEKPSEPKPKKPLSEKQKENWQKCVAKREENRLKRKQEREVAEKQRQEDLNAKILLKAQRIKKAQERVLGPIDELKEEPEKKEEKKEVPIKKQRKIKKKIVVYDDSTTDAGSDGETDSDFYEPEVKKQRRQSFKKPLPDLPAIQSQPIVKKVINFI